MGQANERRTRRDGEPVNTDDWCTTCKQPSTTTNSGLCVWCDTPTINITDPQVVFPPRGPAPLLTDQELAVAADMYYRQGLSLRVVARNLIDGSGYTSQKALTMAVSTQFRLRGWPVNGRVHETRRAKPRRRIYSTRRSGRVRRGEIRDVKCVGVRMNYPRRGEPCRLPALAGRRYCRGHDPELREQVTAELAERRRKATKS